MQNPDHSLNDKELTSGLKNVLQPNLALNEGTVVFLNGPWGAGKTYFWKENLAPQLKDSKCLYISLFGIKDVSDLREKITSSIIIGEQKDGKLSKSLSLVVNNAKGIISGLSNKYLGTNIKFDLLDFISGRYIVCFDDLERIADSASMGQILGFVNYLSEHKKFKCLVILYEDEMLKTGFKDEYLKLREKLGLRTFQLPFNLQERFHAFLQNKSTVYGVDLTDEEKNKILKCLINAEVKNLRIVRFILECYLEMRGQLQQPLPNKALEFMIAMIDHESKGKRESWGFYEINPLSISLNIRKRNGQAESKDSEPDPQVEFYIKYFGENAPYTPFSCVFEIVRNGFINIQSAKSELFPEQESLSETEKLEVEIKDRHLFFCNEEDLKKLAKKINKFFEAQTPMSYETFLSFMKCLSSTIRLLEIDNPTLPPNFEETSVLALEGVDDVDDCIRKLDFPQDDFVFSYLNAIKSACYKERKRRQEKALKRSLAEGTADWITNRVYNNDDLFKEIFDSGQFQDIWASTKLTEELRYGTLEFLIKELAKRSNHAKEIKEQLSKIHTFLLKEYGTLKDKVQRLRMYRLIEKTGLALPADKPKVAT